MAWQLQTAKQKFSELIRLALNEGPQVVTRHGRAVVVIMSFQEYRRLSDGGGDFKEFLLGGPDLDRLEIQRAEIPARVVEL
ncbi:MAG TPA: type II toxin-antitoxin system Phd/YefM family antitoxin [Gemmatimonadota bacterium]|nr:type II toxin-antitoxin system Phd/YefM family antitoxin [Gemmatimonadota bacterium]